MKRQDGFSLLELVVVLAIFALVALIGAQVLQVTARSSERLTEISEESGELATALALLRADMAAGVPRPFAPAQGGSAAPLVVSAQGFALSIGGLARLEAHVTGFGRVEWRLDRQAATLNRAVFTSLTPGAPRTSDVVVLRDVEDIAVEIYRDQAGWGTSLGSDSGRLPRGMRVAITHSRAGELMVTEAMR